MIEVKKFSEALQIDVDIPGYPEGFSVVVLTSEDDTGNTVQRYYLTHHDYGDMLFMIGQVADAPPVAHACTAVELATEYFPDYIEKFFD